MISLCGVSSSYENREVLSDLSLEIKEGEKIALVGPSGSGKSSLIQLIYDKSTMVRTTLIPQQHNLVMNLSVFHNVYIGLLSQLHFATNLRNYVSPSRRRIGHVGRLLEGLELDVSVHRNVQLLSGGQQQRVSIARAMYHRDCSNKSLLLADEPVTGIDEILAPKILNALVSKWTTTVLVLHDLDYARTFTDRVIGLKSGNIVFDKPSSLLTSSDIE